MADTLLVALTAIMAFFTYLVWVLYDRIAWLTGAMESHSTLMLRLEAARGTNDRPVEVIWWDPTIEPFPHSGEHGEVAELDRIYLGLPLSRRKKQKSIKDKLWIAFCGYDV